MLMLYFMRITKKILTSLYVNKVEVVDNADVIVSVNEASSTAELNFKLPRGPRGYTGDTGAQGYGIISASGNGVDAVMAIWGSK